MTRRRPHLLQWDLPQAPPPKHPYRDTLFIYGAFAVIIVLVAWATGGPLGRALVFAAVFFVVACGWSWWRWHQRLSRRAALDPDDEEVQP